jgi:uncharacterized integral membrane protein
LRWLFVVPVALLLIVFAVTNRGTVGISLDPFSSVPPALSIHLPLFLVILIVLMVGVVIGGIAAWPRQRKWRRAARELELELRIARADAEAWKRRAAQPAAAASGSVGYRPPSAA